MGNNAVAAALPAAWPEKTAAGLRLWQKLLLAGLLVLGFGLRMVNLYDPPLDFHPTRQLRAAIIARGMYYDTLPNADPAAREAAIQIWTTMERYEPPILERIVALTYRVIGGEHLWVARIYSSLFWLIGGITLFALVRRALSTGGALFALAFYLILPWGVVASRAFQPDPWMVMWILLAGYALYRWAESGLDSWLWTVLAGLFSGLAVLIKVYAVYPIAGMALLTLLAPLFEGRTPRKNLFVLIRKPQLWVSALLVAAIAGVYYLGLGDRSVSFASFWVLSFIGLLRETKFYIRWLALIHGIMDVAVFFAALVGAVLFSGKARPVVIGLWLGYALIGFTFPYQIYTHDYYSLLLVPIAAISLAPLADAVFRRVFDQPLLWRVVFVTGLLLIGGYYAYVARSQLAATNYASEPYPWQQMGKALPNNGAIIALTHDYGNRLKYFGWRSITRIWPSQGDLDLSAAAAEASGTRSRTDFESYFRAQTEGMDYFLVTLFADFNAQPDLKAMLNDHYPVVGQGDGYILFDLRHPRP